jgi:flavorubredoxin
MTAEAVTLANRPQNPRVLVSAASLHGATAEITQAIGRVLSERGFSATVMAPSEVDAIDDYDAVVIGSAVYVEHWPGPCEGLREPVPYCPRRPSGVAVFQRAGR